MYILNFKQEELKFKLGETLFLWNYNIDFDLACLS